MYIDGQWCSNQYKVESKNPKDESTVGIYYEATVVDISSAVESAKKAYSQWSQLAVEDRCSYISKASKVIIELYGKEGEETPLKKLIMEEMGKVLPEADIEVIESADILNYFSDNASKILSQEPLLLDKNLWPNKQSYIEFSSIGVVGVISPWNYPFELPLWSIVSALVSGNTVIFKPSEHSSLVGLEIAKIFEKIGLPKGVFNVITGGSEVGASLVDNLGVSLISFTGSSAVGEKINMKCAQTFRKAILELGGNDASVVFADADINLAVNGLIWGAFCNAGQVCVGIKRAYIHDSVYDEVIKKLVYKCTKLRLGIEIAPIINKSQLEKIKNLVEDAIQKGANVLVGGSSEGPYFRPTILDNLKDSFLLNEEELFGPVLPVSKFSDINECLKMVNSNEKGLGLSIWSSDLEFSKKFASMAETGMVWINDINIAYPQAPWGGVKKSGNGISLSKFSLLEYVNIKHINYEISSETNRDWWFPY